MLFDGTEFPSTDPNAIYQRRREQAAEFWRAIPAGKFNVNSWQTCALGWLAKRQFDGWHMIEDHPVCGQCHSAYVSAMQYFGIDSNTAKLCFSNRKITAFYHGRWFVRRITADDIAAKMLRLPITQQA